MVKGLTPLKIKILILVLLMIFLYTLIACQAKIKIMILDGDCYQIERLAFSRPKYIKFEGRNLFFSHKFCKK